MLRRQCTSSFVLLRSDLKASFSKLNSKKFSKPFITHRLNPASFPSTGFPLTFPNNQPPKMAEISSAVVVTTSAVALVSGFLLGVYSIRGYLISPELVAERNANYTDPVESEESDIDEDDTILDHAPNWSNGEDADRRQGLRASESAASSKSDVAGEKKINPSEECKLVLVVRTDLGMTKGMLTTNPPPPSPEKKKPPSLPRGVVRWAKYVNHNSHTQQAKSLHKPATRLSHATNPFPAPQQKKVQSLAPPRF